MIPRTLSFAGGAPAVPSTHLSEKQVSQGSFDDLAQALPRFGGASANGQPHANHMMLPNSWEAHVEDRLDILDMDTQTVGAWRYVEAVLARATTFEAAVELLWPEADWGITHDVDQSNITGLQNFLHSEVGAPYRLSHGEWSRVRDIALALPAHFPDGRLDILTPGERKTIQFTRQQVACLVANMALCTLTSGRPALEMHRHWNPWWCNFGVWFQQSSTRSHNYLKTLLSYLKHIGSEKGIDEPQRTLSFSRERNSDALEAWLGSQHPLPAFTLTKEQAQAFAGKPGFAEVDFANKDIGFGVNQTQEELMMGHNPELCVAMLLAPSMAPDEAIIVRGTEVVADYSKPAGGELTWRPLPALEEGEARDWATHEVIAIDALEFDTLAPAPGAAPGALIDLEPAHLVREINKAYAGFSAAKAQTIVTGLWGCGSFGGAAQVKALAQWIAAARAGKNIVFNVAPGFADVSQKFESDLAALTQSIREKATSAGQLLTILLDPTLLPRNTPPESIFECVRRALEGDEKSAPKGAWLDRKAMLAHRVPEAFKDPGYGHKEQWGHAGAGVMMLSPDRQQVLLLKRSQDTQRGGLWSIPGGARPELDGRLAPALATAVAELREEAPPVPEGELWSIPFEYREPGSDFSYSTFFMVLKWPDLYQPRLNWEHSEHEWFPVKSLATRDDVHPGIAEAVSAMGQVLPESISEIIPGLYVGNAASAKNLTLLNTLGIKQIVNCAGGDCGNDHELEIRYLTLPLRDEPESKITPVLARTVSAIDAARGASENVLVHCEMGRSRSVSMVMAYLIAHGDTPRQALNRVRERHPDAAPNRWFLDELHAFYLRTLEVSSTHAD